MLIQSVEAYEAALRDFEATALRHNPDERPRLLELRDALDAYEQAQGHEPPQPTSLAGRLEIEMYKLRLNQKSFAVVIGVSETRLSEVMNGRRKPNLDLIKRLHDTLKIPGDELLELV